MSRKDGREVPVRDVGPVSVVGKCKDCTNDIEMFQSEKEWWERLVKDKNYTFPVRCKTCREKRRAEKATKFTGDSQLKSIAARMRATLSDLDVHIASGVEADGLYSTLEDLIGELEEYAGRK